MERWEEEGRGEERRGEGRRGGKGGGEKRRVGGGGEERRGEERIGFKSKAALQVSLLQSCNVNQLLGCSQKQPV